MGRRRVIEGSDYQRRSVLPEHYHSAAARSNIIISGGGAAIICDAYCGNVGVLCVRMSAVVR